MDEFSVTSEPKKNATVVMITGRVDSFTAEILDTKLSKIVQEQNKLVLDLQNVSYLSSAGVRAFLRVAQSAHKAGGDARLARVPKLVGEALYMVGVLEKLKAYPSVDEALASF